jgi:glucosamine kinase
MLLAVDGGATKTIAVVFGDAISGVGVAGSGNYNNVGIETARKNTETAINGAMAMADCSWNDIEGGIYGFAGVENSAATTNAIEGFLRSIHRNGTFRLYNDGVAAYFLATKGRPGVIAAAGTGSVVQARNGDRAVRTGGWGWLAGDEGSAFYIARRGLQEAAKSYDGRSPKTRLVEAFSKLRGLEFEAVIPAAYGTFAVNKVAALAPIVTSCAREGDNTAISICAEAANELALAVSTAIRKADLRRNYVIGALGGVFRGGDVISDAFRSALEGKGAEFARIYYGYQVVLGSVLLALKDRVRDMDEETEKLLKELDDAITKLPAATRKEFLFMD